MEFDTGMKTLLGIQIVALLSISTLIVLWSQDKAAAYKLYELFGGVTASILTVFGLWKMKEMTSE